MNISYLGFFLEILKFLSSEPLYSIKIPLDYN